MLPLSSTMLILSLKTPPANEYVTLAKTSSIVNSANAFFLIEIINTSHIFQFDFILTHHMGLLKYEFM
jgi:hypothetical protein